MFFICVAAVTAAAAAPPASTHDYMLSGFLTPSLTGKASTGTEHGSEISGEALTVALDVVQAWAVLLTLGFTLIIFLFLAFCVCSSKDDGYDEFEISQGITTVKVCHDGGENGVSLIPRINGSGTESLKATDETSEASSRYTMKRELPAIPTNTTTKPEETERDKIGRPVSQHSSDLYASVNDSTQGGSSFKLIGGVQVLPAGAVAPGGRAAVVKESVSSPEGESAAVKRSEVAKPKEERPSFAQIKKSYPFSQTAAEHPYDKLTTRKSHEAETDTDSCDDSKSSSKDSRRTKSEGRFQSSAPFVVAETQKDQHTSFPPRSEIYQISKTETSGGMVAPPPSHMTTSGHSIVSTHSTSGHAPTSPHYRSPTTPPQPLVATPIPAALAISGRTPANEEMPYMTPPVLQPTTEQPEHFSGDSQDSRGYTSISVREPLAALKARQAAEGAIAALGRTSAGKTAAQIPGSEGEGYYMTVSEDDSADEMYACIYEGSRGGGTGSETYAQIEPRTTPSSHAPPSVLSASSLPSASPTGLSSRTPQDPSPPAPPSVDSLRHVVHSRQASASSSASTGMGSPVAEKRGTRSPLPPLPQGDTVLYSPPEPPILSSQPIPKSPPKAHVAEKPTPRALEEMYAKVLKKPSGHIRGSSSGAAESTDAPGSIPTSTRRGSSDGGRGSRAVTSPTSKDMTHSLVETRPHESSMAGSRAKSCDVSASWGGIVEERKPKPPGNYETITSLYSGSDPGYETVKNGEPPYASVDSTENYPGYETVRGSDIESEPGYETVKHKEFEPGYETVSEISSKKPAALVEPGYESVTTTEYEPGYETVSSKKDPAYESVSEKLKMEYDPGYEELSHPSLDRTSEVDPNYEQLKFSSSSWRSTGEGGDHGYEVVKKQTQESTYELVSDYDTQQMEPAKPDNSAKGDPMHLYASVKKKDSPQKEKSSLLQEKCSPLQEKADIGESKSVEKDKDFTTGSSPIDIASTDQGSSKLADGDSKGTVDLSPLQDIPFPDAKKELVDVGIILDEKVLPQETNARVDGLKEQENEHQGHGYQVMDSPEEVELPPPGEEDNHRVSPPLGEETPSFGGYEIKQGEESQKTEETPRVPPPPGDQESSFGGVPQTVSVNVVEASPQQSSTSSSSSPNSGPSPKEEDSCSKKEKTQEAQEPSLLEGESFAPLDPPLVPSQFSDSKDEPLEKTSPVSSTTASDPLPPPPLPSLEDDLAATASPPPPPPPPIPDEMCNLQDLPPPPLPGKDAVEVNGISPTYVADVAPPSDDLGCAQVHTDLPLPILPPVDLTQTQEGVPVSEESSGGALAKGPACVNGSMTVTVNPMAELVDCGETPPAPPSPQSPSATERLTQPPPGPTAPSADSAESQSSGSTVNGSGSANGSGSVESVVTVDPKSGGDPAITVPPPAPAPSPLQHSSSTSSSESKHSGGAGSGGDPNEGITPV